MKDLTSREKAIMCGLYLSKFDTEGLLSLGFSTFTEAFNVLGFALNAKPSSIKNYRDEMDPYFPNDRQGWHNRKMRDHCEIIYEQYRDYSLEDMKSLVYIITECALASDNQEPEPQESNGFAQRLLTGRAAENFFLEQYRKEPEFSELNVLDVTLTGCGFDFKLLNGSNMPPIAVEVKGIRSDKGSILLTNKEYGVASELETLYYLYVVKNFEEKPFAVKIQNPVNSNLQLKKQERKIVQVSWSTTL